VAHHGQEGRLGLRGGLGLAAELVGPSEGEAEFLLHPLAVADFRRESSRAEDLFSLFVVDGELAGQESLDAVGPGDLFFDDEALSAGKGHRLSVIVAEGGDLLGGGQAPEKFLVGFADDGAGAVEAEKLKTGPVDAHVAELGVFHDGHVIGVLEKFHEKAAIPLALLALRHIGDDGDHQPAGRKGNVAGRDVTLFPSGAKKGNVLPDHALDVASVAVLKDAISDSPPGSGVFIDGVEEIDAAFEGFPCRSVDFGKAVVHVLKVDGRIDGVDGDAQGEVIHDGVDEIARLLEGRLESFLFFPEGLQLRRKRSPVVGVSCLTCGGRAPWGRKGTASRRLRSFFEESSAEDGGKREPKSGSPFRRGWGRRQKLSAYCSSRSAPPVHNKTILSA